VFALARVFEIEPAATLCLGVGAPETQAGSLHSRLLLRVDLERPVRCSFAVRLDVRDQPSDPLRATLPLILAAHRFALAFGGPPERHGPLVWVAAPAARECVFDVLADVGI